MPLGPANSLALPAHLSLELARPLPLSSALGGRIAALTEMPGWLEQGRNGVAPLLSLIARQESKGSLDPTNNRGGRMLFLLVNMVWVYSGVSRKAVYVPTFCAASNANAPNLKG